MPIGRGPKYRLSKLHGLYEDATHTKPCGTRYCPNGQGRIGLPLLSLSRGAVLGKRTPLTVIPKLETSTMSPGFATTGFMSGAAPSGQFPTDRYPRPAAKPPYGACGQNSMSVARTSV